MISTFPRNPPRDDCYDFNPETQTPSGSNLGSRSHSRRLELPVLAPPSSAHPRTEAAEHAGPPAASWLVPALVVAITAFAVYANTLSNAFIDDDQAQVLRNPWIKDFRFLPAIFSRSVWSFMRETTASNYYRPLMHVTYLIEYHFFGFRAWGFHLVNALFHVVNSLLVLLVGVRLSPDPHVLPGRKRTAFLLSFPFVAAILFATHPIHVEAVAFIASVPELTFTGFVLLAFVLYVAAEDRRCSFLLAGSILLFFAALLCKETAIILPALLVVYDLTLRPRTPLRARRLAVYAIYVFIAAVYLVIRYRVLSETLIPAPQSWYLSGHEFVLNALVLFRTYLQKLILPVHLEFWRSFHPISSFLTVDGLSALGVTVLVLSVAILAWRRDRQSLFFIALVVVPLAPAFYISALPGKPFAERYLYLPSVGFVLLAARALGSLVLSGRKRAALAVFCTTTALYAAGTIERNRVWKNAYTLYSDTVQKSPDALLPRYNLAVALWYLGQVDEAIAQYRILIRANPADDRYHSALGAALVAEGREDEAIVELRTANALNPASVETLTTLGLAMGKKGNQEAAIAMYSEALAVDPNYPDAHFNLASALADQGKHDEALEHYRRAIKAIPENAPWHTALGIECAQQGRIDEALAQFEEAVRLAPDEPAYRQNRDRALALKRSKMAPEKAEPRE